MDGNSSDRERDKPPEEGATGGGSGAGEPKVRRKMKTAAQLEALERTFKVEAYPSESVRAELSTQLDLSDRQLQMWFCHRRLKDRKTTNNNTSTPSSSSSKRARKGEASPATVTPPAPPPSTSAAMAADDLGGGGGSGGGELGNEHGSGSGSGSSPYGHVEHRRAVVPRIGVAVPRISHARYYEPPSQPMAEVRAIAFVEAQLGEPLREDGPALGIEFDPLPPGAFGAPIDAVGAPQKQAGRAYEHNLYERPDAKAIKGPGRGLHEYQFLPEQPTARTDAYDRLPQPHYYGSPSDGPSTRTPVRSYLHSGEEVPSYGVLGQTPSLNLMPHHGKHAHHKPSTSEEFDGVARKTPYLSTPIEPPFNSHPSAGLDTGLMPPDRRSMHDEDVVRLERKRKVQSDEVRIQKEVEAHEKRIRKELEKQDLLRRKREEQMRKEMEKHDRERRKEEERLLREKQREEERYQREQRREMDRREKFLKKESIRVEKLKQKEEVRREKEAARQKAANDRAAARRLAKESTELIEDERLELMELAASRKGLQSILALDSETLQNLDSFRDALCQFPPKTVKLKKPFAIQPWTDSEENVGNLLMLWRFFITFADVFGLWPFTLDEYVQAFHDYDPRLLGEIHIALLRSIIKDIEDVARTPSTALGANQSSAANPGGGHPQIVQGAYAWGFNIRSWQQHLSPLTWPEILRQFALSAGFGPKLKKKNIEPPHMRDDNEDDDGMATVSNLRNGAAVENAVAIMQERGYSNPRRSRHRLTPGTVKFAAFHVLSLEGSQGLNILEVADRIQKSGLRDLTTSKTPEASIAAALSRDTKLFERVAPSTYCVRTPYRKDPIDTAAILASAREKIRVFKSGFVNEVEADDVEKDEDSESDTAEDPEVDDPGAVLVTNKGVEPSYEVKRPDTDSCMANGVEAFCDVVVKGPENGVGNTGDGSPLVRPEKLLQLNDAGASVDQSIDHGAHNEVFNTDQEDNDIDESSPCEPWVQGLMEGDYSDLSVEERLSALVALVGVAIEGNSVRIVLEERLEAATALKKQMWAEAQLDKRRLKEENMSRSQYPPASGSRMETNVTTCIGENRQSPLLAREGKYPDASPNYAGQQEQLPDAEQDQKPNADTLLEKNSMNLDSLAAPDNPSVQQSMYAAAERTRAQMKSYIGHKAEEMYVYRSLPLGMDRRRNRYWQFIASASCNDPGSGRIFVELHTGGWRLIDIEEAFDTLLASLDVRGIRESHLHALLQRVETLFKESIKRKRLAPDTGKSKADSMKTEGSEVVASHPDSSEDSPNSTISALNPDGPETSSSFQVECGRNNVELKNILKRYKDVEEWMWKECFMSSNLRAKKYGSKRCTQILGICGCCHDLFFFEDRHCPTCHNTFTSDMNVDFSDHVACCEEMLKFNPMWRMKGLDSLAPVRIRLLKAQLALVEVSLPTEALHPSWTDEYRRSWSTQLLTFSSADDLLQALTALEGAIKKDFLSMNFQTTKDLLASSNRSKLDSTLAFNVRDISVLPWIPKTTAAVALRLVEFDSSVSYTLQQREEFRKEIEAGAFLNIPPKFTMVRNVQGNEFGGHNGENFLEENWLDPSSGAFGLGSSKGGRGRGGARSRSARAGGIGSQRRLPGGSRQDPSRRNVVSTSEKSGAVVGGWRGSSARARGGSKKRSRRTARSRPKPAKKAGPKAIAAGNSNSGPVIFHRSPPGTPAREEDEDWNGEEAVQMQAEPGDGNDSNSEYEYEDNGQAYVSDNYEDMVEDDGYVGSYGGKTSAGMMMEGGSDDNVDEADEDEEDRDEDEEEDMDGDMPEEYRRVDYGGAYEQGADGGEEFEQDVDVEGYLNADSEDEGNEDEGVGDGNRNLDQDEGLASPTSSSEYSD